MPEIVIPYSPRSQFRRLHDRSRRWAIAVAHRRAGKTVATINDLIRGAITCNQREPRFAYIAPYFAQAKDVAWSYLKHYTAPIPGIQANESELRVDLPNGGRVRLYGADNYDRLRGIYLDGVVLDEYGDMDPRAWQEVIRAALADRKGWALFIGTPRGMNHFAEQWERAQNDPDWLTLRLRASETGLLDPAELAAARREMSEEQYLAEFECSFAASVIGAIWGREMQAAETEGRVCAVPYQPEALVDTWWDLGIDDATAIWFSQTIGREIHLIDCYEASGEGLPHYAKTLQSKPYLYGTHNAPHDIRVRELGSGRSRLEIAESLGIRFQVVPQIGRQDGIEAGRSFLARCWFDRVKTQAGRQALTSYRRVWDEKRRTFQDHPLHDWASNYCFVGETEVLTPYGMRQIMNLPHNGKVLTQCGWTQYEGPRLTKRNAPLVAVEFAGGYTVKCTPDHMFLTESGWKSAELLSPGTLIQSCSTRSRSISRAACIASGLVSGIYQRAVRFSTVMFGERLLEIYRSVATSTIGTATCSTIILPISNALIRPSIVGYRATRQAHTVPAAGHRLTPWRAQPIGTDQKKADFGIVATHTGPKAGSSGNGKPSRALSVVLTSLASFARAAINRFTAPRHVRCERISSVRRLTETADVWDITTPGVGSFCLGNGAVVHNSDAFRYLAVGHKVSVAKRPSAEPRRMMQASGEQSAAWLGV